MTYDSFVTAAIVEEAQALVGAYVDHIAQPSERDLCVTFYPGRGKDRWLFSADPRHARVHRIAAKPENPAVAPNFCMLLRKWIDGARLTAVRQVGFDRVLRWEFTRSDGDHTLIAELMGAGEFDVALTFSEAIERMKRKGAPVEWVKSFEPIVVSLHPVAIAADAPHPEAARLFVDFLLSEEGQSLIRASGRISPRRDRSSAPGEAGLKLHPVDPAAASDYEGLQREWRAIFK